MGKKKDKKKSTLIELSERKITVGITKSFSEYGNNKIMLSDSGLCPEGTSKEERNKKMYEMYENLNDLIDEIGEDIVSDIPF